jgi:hypothetical protein
MNCDQLWSRLKLGIVVAYSPLLIVNSSILWPTLLSATKCLVVVDLFECCTSTTHLMQCAQIHSSMNISTISDPPEKIVTALKGYHLLLNHGMTRKIITFKYAIERHCKHRCNACT